MRALSVVVLLLTSVSPGIADVIDFEALPSANMFSGGGQNIGSLYPGVTFGPNVTGLDLTGSAAFPPHSGSVAVWDPFDLTVTISFADPQTNVGFWYTSFDLLTFSAFDSANTLLTSAIAAANTDGTTGSSDFISLSAPNISSVTLEGSPGGYVFDDLTLTSGQASPVPEPSSVVLLSAPLVILCLSSRWVKRS